jgi:hypothetical protein
MAKKNMMQVERRRDPVPWGPELWLGCGGIALLFFLLVGVQIGRTLANIAASGSLTWPEQTKQLSSDFGVLGGDASAGLAHRLTHPASSTTLYVCIVIVEVLVLVAFTWGVVEILRRWGPWRVKGMASREDADALLGLTRLRKQASVIRPDLYGKKPTGLTVIAPFGEDYHGTDSRPMGYGLSEPIVREKTDLLEDTLSDLPPVTAEVADHTPPAGPVSSIDSSRSWN